MENKSLIKLDDVTVKFKKHLVLDKVCMEFESGKIYGIIGRNGSGKTVLLKCICGLMDTTDGTVSVNGKIVGKDVILSVKGSKSDQDEKTVTGTVVDETGEPIIGANIVEKGKANGTMSDLNGHFSICLLYTSPSPRDA